MNNRIDNKVKDKDKDKVYFGEEARKVFLDGLEFCEKAIKHTLGPANCAKVTALDLYGETKIFDDGAEIISHLNVSNHELRLGINLIKSTITKLNDRIGDASTSSCLLAVETLRACLKAIDKGYNPSLLKEGLIEALKVCNEHIDNNKREITLEEVYNLALVSSNRKDIAKLLFNAYSQIGLKDGFVHIKRGNGIQTNIDVKEGFQTDIGYLSPYFCNERDTLRVNYINPLVLVSKDNLTSNEILVSILEHCVKDAKPLVIFGTNFSEDIISTVAVNNVKNVINCCLVKVPSYNGTDLLEDIAAVTAAKLISQDKGTSINSYVNIETFYSYVGTASSIKIDNKSTSIVCDERGNVPIMKQIGRLQTLLDKAVKDNNIYKQGLLSNRISALRGTVAVLTVCAPTETELDYLVNKLEDSINSLDKSIEGGVIPLTSSFTIHLSRLLKENSINNEYEEVFNLLSDCFKSCLLKTIILNRNKDDEKRAEEVVEKVFNSNDDRFGYDVIQDKFMDLVENKLYDPATTLKKVLETVVSIVNHSMTANCILLLHENRIVDME